jgi:hypothetical protein
VLKVVSVVYMLWLAWKIAHAAPPEEKAGTGTPLTFLQAAAFQWVNPKAWAMALTAVIGPCAGRAVGQPQLLARPDRGADRRHVSEARGRVGEGVDGEAPALRRGRAVLGQDRVDLGRQRPRGLSQVVVGGLGHDRHAKVQRLEFGHREVQGRQRDGGGHHVAHATLPLDRDARGDERVHVSVDRPHRHLEPFRHVGGAVEPPVPQDLDQLEEAVGAAQGSVHPHEKRLVPHRDGACIDRLQEGQGGGLGHQRLGRGHRLIHRRPFDVVGPGPVLAAAEAAGDEAGRRGDEGLGAARGVEEGGLGHAGGKTEGDDFGDGVVHGHFSDSGCDVPGLRQCN